MSWLVLAILGPFFWALSNIIDERLVQRIFKEPLGLTVITGLFNTIPLAVIPFFHLPEFVGSISLIAFAAGVLGISIYYPYLKALEITNAAITVVLWNFVPVFVLIFSQLLLKEVLTGKDYLAIALFISASLLVTLNRTSGKTPWKAFALMAAASLLYTSEITLEKFVYGHTDFLNGYWWFCLGELTTALVVLGLHRRTRRVLLDRLDKKFFALNLSNEALNGAGSIFVSAAVSLGPVAVVNAVGKIQPIMVLLTAAAIGAVSKQRIHTWKRGFVLRVVSAVALSIVAVALVGSRLA